MFEIVGSALHFLVILLPFVLGAIAQHQDKVNSPEYKELAQNDAINKAVAAHDVNTVALILNAQLMQLRNKSSSNPG